VKPQVADLEGDVRGLLAAGRKISAIAHYHQATGAGLAQAKQAVDNIERGLPADTPSDVPTTAVWRGLAPSNQRQSQLEAHLPPGWSLERLRRIERSAELLEPEAHQAVMIVRDEHFPLDLEVIINFGGLCLVRARGEDGWYMGQIASDGSITCWGDYGPDLAKAIESL
jgi:hypothetical protein